MIIVIPGAYNAQTGVPGGNVQGQTITVGAILKVTERDRRPYPSDPGVPSEIWIDNTAAIGYICKENGPTGTVWDRLDLLGDYIAFGDGDPGPNADITWGFRPGSLRYARNTQTLWICDNNTQGAAIWSVLGGGGSTLTLQTNGIANGDQTLLNIVQGSNMLITDDGLGNITFSSTGGGGGTYTVNNGLTESPPNNFQLGGTLVQSTVLTAGAFATPGNRLRFDALSLDTVGGFYFTALTSPSYTVNDILSQFWSIGATSLKVISDNLYGGLSSYGLWLEARNAGATGLYLETKDLSAIPLHARNSVAGYNLMFLRSNGELELPRYGTGIFAGTPAYALGVDAVGNVVEFTPSIGTTYTVDNGLTENPSGNFQLGSTTSGGAPLLHDTYIDTTANHTLYLEGQKTSNNDFILDVDNSTADGGAIRASAVGNGNAIRALSSSGSALAANSTGAPAISATTGGATEAGLFVNSDTGTNNIVQGIKLRHSSSGVPAPGFGVAADFTGKTTLNSDLRLGRLIYQWTDPVTISRTSKFQLETVNLNAAGIKLEVDGPGQLKLNNYGQTPANFSGTPVWGLGVDLNGNVIEYSPGTGGGDMLKSVYDVDNDGVVDSSERVEIIVRNSTGSTLTKGQIVYLSGATGNRPNALLSDASTEATSSKTIGMVVADIANNSDGYVAVNGTLHDLNTNSFAAGDTLWLDTTPGGMVANTPPAEPNHAVFIGYVARAHPTLGRVVLKIQNGYELNELHGVLISSEANNDLLVYETSSTLWKNKSLSTAYPNIVTGSFGVTVDGVTSVIQVGQVGYVEMPYAGSITNWSITGNATGSIVFDVWKASGVIPTVANTMIGLGTKPSLSSQQINLGVPTGWTTVNFLAGDILGFYVDSASILKRATLTLRTNKS